MPTGIVQLKLDRDAVGGPFSASGSGRVQWGTPRPLPSAIAGRGDSYQPTSGFHQPDFVARVARCLQETGADPARLKLELTESLVLEGAEKAASRMHELNALGVTFALDDFGTGYSSLSYLKLLPLNQVKIDRSFVRDVIEDASDAAIVRAILAMSKTLGLQVIAEGVERQEQRDFLLQNGCSAFQGYLFGKPMPIEQWRGCHPD